MTRFGLFPLAALAFVVGCVDNPGECLDNSCDSVVDDDTGNPVDFEATIHVVVPFGWTARAIGIDGEVIHEDTTECYATVTDWGTYKIQIGGELFDCLAQEILVGEPQNGMELQAVSEFEAEGQCALTPDNADYGSFRVNSAIADRNDDGIDEWGISIGSWSAITTGDTFYGDDRTETSGSLIEGKIAKDLSSIYYHRVSWNGDESEATIYLQDK